MKYLDDKKSWTIATVESLVILLFNVLFTADLLKLLGGCTQGNIVALSTALFFARYILFYISLVWRRLWGT
jgi:hypothetical protein